MSEVETNPLSIIACRTNCVGSDQISTSDRHGDPEGNADLYAGVGV